ncbi:BamA/TamA family outer membrane protein [Pontibacter sp. E15-1]|uniref:translocation and assembly module lipoprotein TamL n=1 Tax=Pontibacter sp. E15-1 TaxID=2919918 RepID=UPI001F4F1D7D|nr:BamA/TamA family outer membrane protein [Pontibacter sp. E15-1]MCJ8163590.1 BamA/TamA family outer membrane protein [Pontibacter sp. E15-1]
MACLQACIPTRYLAEDEKLLVGIQPKGLETVDPTAIEALYRQEPNRLVLGSAPYLALYNFGKKFYDPQKIQQRIEKQEEKRARKIADAGTDAAKIQRLRAKFDNRVKRLQDNKKEGNLLMQIGEPPAIYDSTLMVETMQQIGVYLNAKGYFNHRASYEKEVKDEKLVTVTINIEENAPYRYTDFSYSIPDSAMLRLVQSTSGRSLLQLGERYDEDKLSAERDRLYNLMKNSGYYDFARAYLAFEVDTSFAGKTAHVKTIIQRPDQGGQHPLYTLRNVYFKTDADRFGIARDTILYNGIHYVAYRHRFSPLILDKKVDIYPGQLYSQLKTATTQRKLSDLDVFQFNNVLYNKSAEATDSSAGLQLDAFVNALPAKKFQETIELGLNFTERTPGPFSSARLRVRNLFGGAENLDIGLRGGIEGQISIANNNQTVLIREFGADVALSFPVILFPFSDKNLLSAYSPRTRIYTGYTNSDRQQYIRTNYELGLDYIWQVARNPLRPPVMQFIFSPINLNVVQGEILDRDFARNLIENSEGSRSLIESFSDGIISFVGFSFIYNTNDFAQTRNARYFRGLVEIGGLSKELGLDLSNNQLQTFQYFKINPDYRRYIPLGGKRFFVYRLNAGVASPIFDSTVLPYEKHFFSGGASSIRAWQSRRLGLGSYAAINAVEETEPYRVTTTRDYDLEQPGEVLVEANVEYRFNFFSFLNGALFVDAGNVWLLKPDANRPRANFEFNRFYKELAVGTGVGLRLDLSVLILRFDLATKVYDPAGLYGKKFVLNDFNFTDFFTRNNQSTLQIGIGYPF